MSRKVKNLTEGPLFSKIVLYTLPLVATAILQLLFNTADIIVVGRWGGDTAEACANSLAAVGYCSNLCALLITFFFGLSVGSGVCVAHDIGAGHEDEVQKTVSTAVITALASGLLVGVCGFVSARPLLVLMGTDAAVLEEATLYMKAYLCGIPASMLYNFCAAILRSKGDTVRPLLFLSIAGVANVLLNLVAVILFRWGALGVGVATAASQWISCIATVIYMMRMNDCCRIDPMHLTFHMDKFKRILYNGVPSGIQSLLFSFSNVLVQTNLNTFGAVVVAGNTAAANLDGYIYAVQNTLHMATVTFVAQHDGAQKYGRLKRAILYCSLSVVVVGITLSSVVYLFRYPLLGIYAPGNPSVVEAGCVRIGIMCATYFACGLMEAGSGALRGMGRSLTAMIISLLGGIGLRITWLYTVFAWWPKTPDNTFERLRVLYFASPLAWVLTTVMLFLFTFITLNKKVKAQKLHAQDLAEESPAPAAQN
ncbi:MAG: MATE family efflux transporter [Clostridia bacterium]|nr:MATE family efflux transporter [Clostridia bacterium]